MAFATIAPRMHSAVIGQERSLGKPQSQATRRTNPVTKSPHLGLSGISLNSQAIVVEIELAKNKQGTHISVVFSE